MGPLTGLKIIELAGLGPGPYAGMLLADMGADVICIERHGGMNVMRDKDISYRNKRSLLLDLKTRRGVDILFRLLADADGLIEGFRPGVLERLGIGAEPCLAHNPRLIYGRITGWGQEGPLARAPGHDLNYVSLSGALHAIGADGEPPVVPLNLVGDMGGGGMLLAFGMVCALLECKSSGKGQVVDAAMVDGAASQTWMLHSMAAAGAWDASRRGVNLLDGGAHFYATYETADGEYLAVGAIEPQFYAALVELAGLDAERFGPQMDAAQWPELRAALRKVFKTRTRAEWLKVLEGSDACVSPVLSVLDAPDHPHNVARGAFVELDGFAQPAPAPRFGRSHAEVRHGIRAKGQDTDDVLTSLGLDADEIRELRRDGVAG